MVVGIAGHIHLPDPQTEKWVENVLFNWLAQHDVDLGLTCLAPGADQIFADVCFQQSIPFRAFIPCLNYADQFSIEDRIKQETSIKRAQAKVTNLVPPSEQAYWEAMLQIVDHCDVLLGVWDGLPPKGLGGTGATITYACRNRIPVVHFHIHKKSIGIICNSENFPTSKFYE